MDARTEPQLDIQYADAARFHRPDPPVFGTGGSILSLLSLLFMTTLATIMVMQLLNPGYNAGLGFLPSPEANGPLAPWVWLPFAFTIFGAGLGFVFETGLLVNGTPFQQGLNRFTTFIRSLRLLNLAPVITTIFFFVCSMTIAEPALRMALLDTAAVGCFALGLALVFGGAQAAVGLILMAIQVAQIILVLSFGAAAGGTLVAGLLIGAAVLQLASLKIGALTPLKSTAFHVLSTLSGVALYRAILGATAAQANFSHHVALALPPGSLARWGFVVACLAGLALADRAWPVTHNSWRAVLSNALWSVVYFVLVSAKRFPKPHNLSQVYKNGAPQPVQLLPYSQRHPQYMPAALNIPAVNRLERNVTVLTKVLAKAKNAFALIALLDHVLPQANAAVSPERKTRMQIWSDGSNFWPRIFTWNIFGYTIPGRTLEKTPEPAIAAYKEGQLYAYLTEFGVATTFAKPVPGGEQGLLVADFRYMEAYETKPGYESYGGLAYLRVNSEAHKLELVSVVAPGTDVQIRVNPHDPTFRRAEAQVIASMYYAVVAGKHLAEIHMTYNLVEATLHNAFDAQGVFNHPFRTFMYLHLFSHELAEELTTEHLVQEGAVFTQIFATTHDGMINHLNDAYHRFRYGEDEDFEARAEAMTMANGKVLPRACITWEVKYAEIWQDYTRALIDIIYPDDQAVADDPYLQDFHDQLCVVLLNGLPPRYAGFKTRAGVARFAADTIHHMVVRHQVYGTTGVKAAMDPRINKMQIPRDGGTLPIDEWRSLACVALATGRARFVLLDGDWRYLLEGVDAKYREPMAVEFDRLQDALRRLDEAWTNTEVEQQYNYDYFRAIPSALHTGAGY